MKFLYSIDSYLKELDKKIKSLPYTLVIDRDNKEYL